MSCTGTTLLSGPSGHRAGHRRRSPGPDQWCTVRSTTRPTQRRARCPQPSVSASSTWLRWPPRREWFHSSRPRSTTRPTPRCGQCSRARTSTPISRPTGSGPPATPNWGLVTPFTLTSGSQFRPPPPAGISAMPQLLASTQYATNFNDVKDLGRYNSTSRTADQTQAAFFWANDVDTTYKPPGQHFAHTQAVSRQQGLTQAGNARLFALVALAMADAAITAWDSKYLTPIDLWRPETAIHLALDDGNGATSP